jgi:hypothetical protein
LKEDWTIRGLYTRSVSLKFSLRSGYVKANCATYAKTAKMVCLDSTLQTSVAEHYVKSVRCNPQYHSETRTACTCTAVYDN